MNLNVNVNFGVTPEFSDLVRRLALAVLAARGLTFDEEAKKAQESPEETEQANDQPENETAAGKPAEAPAAEVEKPKRTRKAKAAPEPEPAPMPASEEPMPMDPEPEPVKLITSEDIRAHLSSMAQRVTGEDPKIWQRPVKAWLNAHGCPSIGDVPQELRQEFINWIDLTDPNLPF